MLISHISPPVPLAQRIARWTSNPKVLGSISRWDDRFFVKQLLLYSILTLCFFSLQLYPHPYAGLLSQKVVQNPIYPICILGLHSKFSWCSGYHICLTHRRSPVRSRAKTAVPRGLTARISGFHPGGPGSTPGVGSIFI